MIEQATRLREMWEEYLPESSQARALLAGAEALERGWRPIETAPKDGTTVLVWWAGDIARAAYLSKVSHGREDGWYILRSRNWIGVYDHELTHWMPLPDPPEVTR